MKLKKKLYHLIAICLFFCPHYLSHPYLFRLIPKCYRRASTIKLKKKNNEHPLNLSDPLIYIIRAFSSPLALECPNKNYHITCCCADILILNFYISIIVNTLFDTPYHFHIQIISTSSPTKSHHHHPHQFVNTATIFQQYSSSNKQFIQTRFFFPYITFCVPKKKQTSPLSDF